MGIGGWVCWSCGCGCGVSVIGHHGFGVTVSIVELWIYVSQASCFVMLAG